MPAPDIDPQRWRLRGIRTLQILSIVLMWSFLGGAVAWMVNAVQLSLSLGDALTVSVGLSLVVIPVYTLVASVLTYVFFGLQRGRRTPED
jgi:CHASE2 domain-containing sensor protein